MLKDGKIWVANNDKGENIFILPKMANRHGLIAGATGTGKTITLKVMAESFSDAGVPVFMADAKGDLSATCMAGSLNDSLRKRIESIGMDPEAFDFHGYPVTFWDVFQKTGIPLRTTVSEMGPLLLSRIMEILMEDMDFYRKVMASSTAPLMQEQLVEFVIQYLLDQEELYALGNHRQYELTIRFCAGGLSNLYRDWFFGKLDMPLEELNAQGARMIRGVLNQALTNPVK